MFTKKALYIISAITLSISSCSKDELYQNPSTSLSDETVVQSYEAARTVLMGAYDQTGHYHYLTIGQIGLEVMGNDAILSSGEFGFPTYNWNVFSYNYVQYPRVVDGWWSSYSSYLWNRAYRAIDAANLLINSDLPAGSEDLKTQAYGIRAWNFMNLYHLFCAAYNNKVLGGDNGKGLFLRLEKASSDINQNVKRSNLKESIAQIISDFEYVYNNSTITDNKYINKNAAALFLARIYLEINDFANASKYAKLAASNNFSGSNLMSQEEYQSGFATANSEWLWGFGFDGESTNIYASIPSFYYMATTMNSSAKFGTKEYGTKVPGNSIAEQISYLSQNAVDYMTGYSTIRYAKSFVDLFAKDANGSFKDYRALFPFYLSENDGYVPAKFKSKGSLGIADYPMARIAEAYLIEAEAQFRLGNNATALSVLNALQNKRNGTISTTLSLDEIWKERRRELYGEGFAITDIKRLEKPLERVGPEQWSSVKSLPANSPRMMYPIPDAELLYNPFYKNPADYNSGQNDYWFN